MQTIQFLPPISYFAPNRPSSSAEMWNEPKYDDTKNLVSSGSSSSTSSEVRLKKPANAYILYRQFHHKQLSQDGKVRQSQISKITGINWRALTNAERLPWEIEARKLRDASPSKVKKSNRHKHMKNKNVSCNFKDNISQGAIATSIPLPCSNPIGQVNYGAGPVPNNVWYDNLESPQLSAALDSIMLNEQNQLGSAQPYANCYADASLYMDLSNFSYFASGHQGSHNDTNSLPTEPFSLDYFSSSGFNMASWQE